MDQVVGRLMRDFSYLGTRRKVNKSPKVIRWRGNNKKDNRKETKNSKTPKYGDEIGVRDK